MTAAATHTAVLDIGKTTIKCHVLSDAGASLWSRARRNTVADSDPYPHFDTEAIWRWLLEALSAAAGEFAIGTVNVSTHGACAALLDEAGGLALPVLDYEYPVPEDMRAAYAGLRPDFRDSLSPALPLGLNLGRQLHWQRDAFPGEFARARTLLPYPQYWAWRLSGIAVAERTSLGCHTDLWLPREDTYSPLLTALGLAQAVPPLAAATQALGPLLPDVAAATGLPADCIVYPGVHDSNASFARYLYAPPGDAFTAVSTGTWVVTMARGGKLDALDETRDTLANVDVLGTPLPCARFMGGREFEAICALTGTALDDPCTEADVERLVDRGVHALPAFAEGGGPFHGQVGRIVGTPASGKALATLYNALMIDYELDLLGAQGDIVFGSSSRKNPLMCRLLAQLRPRDRVMLSGDDAGTVTGAWCLTRWDAPPPLAMTHYDTTLPTGIAGLEKHRDTWRGRAAG